VRRAPAAGPAGATADRGPVLALALSAMGIENPVHLLFIAVVALVVLGPRRLPELARALGKGVREFREAINSGSSPHEPGAAARPDADPLGAPADGRPPAAAEAVDPAQAVRSVDAPDSGSL
jgi:sec-independent protein translocase protein TatA